MPNVEIFPHIPNHHFTLRNATKWRENKRKKPKRKIDHTNCHAFFG